MDRGADHRAGAVRAPGLHDNLFGLAADVVPTSVVATVIALKRGCRNLSGAAIIEAGRLVGLEHGHGYWPMLRCGGACLLALGWIQLMLPPCGTIHEHGAAAARGGSVRRRLVRSQVEQRHLCVPPPPERQVGDAAQPRAVALVEPLARSPRN